MHLSPHERDALLAELLPAERAAELRAHAAGCEACAAALRETEADRQAFLTANPPAARARALLETRPRFGLGWLLGSAGVAAAAAAALVFALVPRARDEVRLKGGASIVCRIARGAEVLGLMTPGERREAKADDVVSCIASPSPAGAHLEVWGAFSGSATRLLALEVTAPVELPSSFAVHDRGEMRLYFLRSAAPPAGATVAETLAALPDRPEIGGATVEWIAVRVR